MDREGHAPTDARRYVFSITGGFVKKSILEIYSLLVCFAAISCFVISLGIALYALIEIGYPEFTLNSYQFERHQTNEAFLKSFSDEKDSKYKDLPENEVTKKREESYNLQLKAEKRSAFQSLIQLLIIILIDVIVFIVHWRMAKTARLTSTT